MSAPLEWSSLRSKCFIHQRLQRNESLGHLVSSHVCVHAYICIHVCMCLAFEGGWAVELVESLRIPRGGETGMGSTWITIWARVPLPAGPSHQRGVLKFFWGYLRTLGEVKHTRIAVCAGGDSLQEEEETCCRQNTACDFNFCGSP